LPLKLSVTAFCQGLPGSINGGADPLCDDKGQDRLRHELRRFPACLVGLVGSFLFYLAVWSSFAQKRVLVLAQFPQNG
jgi:hypothetical protein